MALAGAAAVPAPMLPWPAARSRDARLLLVLGVTTLLSALGRGQGEIHDALFFMTSGISGMRARLMVNVPTGE